jgi:nitrogen fixation NifU-like protein
MYKDKVIEHFRNPKNMGKIENPDGVGKVGNMACGDVMWLYIRIKRRAKSAKRKSIGNLYFDRVIKEVGFETFGCVAAIATSSAVTELVKGKTLREALKLTNQDVIEGLGELPPIKVHCSVLAVDALREAIYDYLSKEGLKIPDELEKQHRRIGLVTGKVEERYGEWVGMEGKAVGG